MLKGWCRRFAVLGVVATLLVAGGAASGQQLQPGYDVLRVSNERGEGIPYVLWVAWNPTIVTTPDGGAWAFFSALPAGTEGAGNRGVLYAARFNPESGVWEPAQRLPGGVVQFGATAAVDSTGKVHLVFSNRTGIEGTDFSTLVYTSFDGAAWSEPVAVAANEAAGHQLSPQLTVDGSDVLHVIWQDQRNATPDQRTANAAYADIFVSDFVNGAWSNPVQVSTPRPDPETEANGSRPHIVADGDRLIATWSIYSGVTEEALLSAVRVDWSSRPLSGDAAAWATPQPLIEKGDAVGIGGRLVDLVADPNGGVVALYGRRTDTNELYIRRIEAGTDTWSAELQISAGEQGSYPSLGVAPDGTVYVVYENGGGPNVDVGGLAVAAASSTPGAASVISPGEAGAQGRPMVATDQSGGVWVIYYHQAEGQAATEVRVLRAARLSTEPAPATPDATAEA